MRRAAAILLVALAAWLAGAQQAGAQATALQGTAKPGTVFSAPPVADPNALTRPASLTEVPPNHRLTGAQAQSIASRVGKLAEALRQHPTAKPEVFLKGTTRWQVSWFTPGTGPARKEIAQVLIDDLTGGVQEAWTGPQVAWTMARGYPGAFGRKVNSPWVWIPLTILFLAPFINFRRPLRLLHLDLAVLAAFGISVAFFNDANLDVSVPLVAPLLAYVLLRMLWVGLRGPRGEPPRLHLNVPVMWLAVAVVFLVGFRVGLNVTSSNVIDVGYSGVLGADKIMDGTPLYGAFPADNPHGDTYGPVNYLAYVPFEQAMPWSGRWDELPAAHGAAILFDLLTLLLAFLLGSRIGGRGLGIVAAYAWAAWPFSLYALNTNTNDSLVAALALLAVYVAANPMGRGAATALGALTKFGSLGLVPLLALHGTERGTRAGALVRFAVGFALVAFVVSIPVLMHGPSLPDIYDRTIGYQASRPAPFSIWGLYEWKTLQHLWQALTVVLALAVGLLPGRRRDLVGLAALSAAVFVALQLSLTYWFYLYLVWFFPLAIVALFGCFRAPVVSYRAR